MESGALSTLPAIAGAEHPVDGDEGQGVLLDKGGGVEGAALDEFIAAELFLGDVKSSGFLEEEVEVSVRL